MLHLLAVFIGKCISLFSVITKQGAGATWPGEIALFISVHILHTFFSQFKQGIILVAGTNGKTTTTRMIVEILVSHKQRVVTNASGANLVNGIVSSCIGEASWDGELRHDWGVFEVDENALPKILSAFRIRHSEFRIIVVLLNIFRDQLDRYGEVDVIAEKWANALKYLPKQSALIINADDPLVVAISKEEKDVSYFGLDNTRMQDTAEEHATDSLFCPWCNHRLRYTHKFFSHLGIWQCSFCGHKRPTPSRSSFSFPLPGVYNQYNTLAAVRVARHLHINHATISHTLKQFTPAFGRQEEFRIAGKRVKIFLSKNPVGLNESIKTVLSMKAKHLLFVLNDQIPDGRDVSWIWDVDMERIPETTNIVVSGDRVYDMALRIKYARSIQNDNDEFRRVMSIEPDLKKAIEIGLQKLKTGDTLYILPTYSAMLEVRKILVGRKIL